MCDISLLPCDVRMPKGIASILQTCRKVLSHGSMGTTCFSSGHSYSRAQRKWRNLL